MCQTTLRQCAGTHEKYDSRYISCTQTTATIDSTRRTRGIFSARKCSTSLKLKSFSLEHSTSWVLRHWRRRRETLTNLCVVSASFACAKHHLTCITYAHIYSGVLLLPRTKEWHRTEFVEFTECHSICENMSFWCRCERTEWNIEISEKPKSEREIGYTKWLH